MQDELISRLIAQITIRENRINELEQTVIQQTHALQGKDKRIAQLEQVIDEITREKLSIESELENLRGY